MQSVVSVGDSICVCAASEEIMFETFEYDKIMLT